jgi:TPR repeat protein
MRAFLLLATSLAALSAMPGHARAEARNPYAVAVIIGNKTYQNHDIPEVKYADRDAQAVKNYVVDVLGYAEENIIYVENATQGNLNSIFGSADDPKGRLARYLWRGGKSDVLVYYSGHGVPSLKDGESYLLPVDADPNAVTQNGYPLKLLYENLRKIDAHSVTVVLDACFSGASADGPLIRNASVMTRPASAAPAEAAGLTVLAASQADQVANWDGRHKHGLFTEYFLEAVYGRADDAQYGGHRDGKITLAAVKTFLDDEMSYVAQREGRDQNATVSGDPAIVLASLTPDPPPLRHDDGPLPAPPAQATPAAAPPAAPPPPAPAQAAPAPAPPAPVAATPQADEDALKLSNADRRSVQQWLAALGHDTGGSDGVFGPTTRAAVAAWQRAIGAPASGYLTADLFARLRRDGAARLEAVAKPLPAPAPSAAAAPVPAAPAEELARQGDAAFKRRDYTAAMALYRQAAAAGHTEAMRSVGTMSQNGEGVAVDYGEAMRWFRAAADKGNAHAMNDIGVLYDRGHGVAQDFAEALRWYRKADERGNEMATYNIGLLFANGHGVPQDFTEAMRYYRRAADKGNALAMGNIGYLYDHGDGVAQDYAEAMRWYRQAADLGSGNDMKNLGVLYEYGRGVPQDYAEAMRWYRKAHDKGNDGATYNIGLLYANGRGVPQDYAEAMRWYREAADKGNAGAMNNIGVLYGTGHGVAEDQVEALRWYRLAAAKGNPVAMRNIGLHYKTGSGVPIDLAEARRWLARAADLGDQTARAELAKL